MTRHRSVRPMGECPGSRSGFGIFYFFFPSGRRRLTSTSVFYHNYQCVIYRSMKPIVTADDRNTAQPYILLILQCARRTKSDCFGFSEKFIYNRVKRKLIGRRVLRGNRRSVQNANTNLVAFVQVSKYLPL